MVPDIEIAQKPKNMQHRWSRKNLANTHNAIACYATQLSNIWWILNVVGNSLRAVSHRTWLFLKCLDEHFLMSVAKPLMTNFGIHHRLESCGHQRTLEYHISMYVSLSLQIIWLTLS